MSEQHPPGTPAEGPDPFAELLKGLIEEPTAEQPVPAEPVTSSADVPTVAFTPFEAPTVVPPSVEQSAVTGPPLEEPTVAFTPEPMAAYPDPIPASGTPSSGLAPTVVLPGAIDPTAATTVLAGGVGGGLPPSEPPRGGGFRDWDPRRKALFITLVSVAGVLLIALVILLVVLLGGNKSENPVPTSSPAPTASPTPTRTATPTPTPTPTIKPAIQSFSVDTNTAVCSDTAAGTTVMLHFAWTVVGTTTQIAIASGASAVDAIASPFQNNLPATETRFPMPFGCNNAQLTYSLTAAGPDGQRYSGVVTVVRQVTPPAPVPDPTISSFSVTYDSAFDTCTADPISTANPTFNWATANSSEVAIGVGHVANAFTEGYTAGLPSSGSASMPFDCSLDEREYTVSAKNSAGTLVTSYVTVFNPADPGGDGPTA